MAFAGKPRRILIIVENLPVPFDRRVWQQACTLVENGYQVSIICPKTKDFEVPAEIINGIAIYRHPLPVEANSAIGYLVEYSLAFFWQSILSWKIFFKSGFDVIQGCNPPDTVFLIALQFKFFGVKYLFDHHDLCPELFLAKYHTGSLYHWLLRMLERANFATADVSIATNESYRRIAIERGKVSPDRVFVVRNGPNLDRIKLVNRDADSKKGRKYLVGYVGVMGQQEGIDHLLQAIKYCVEERNRYDIQFALIGSGPALKEMKEYAKQLGIAEYATFYGRVPDSTLLRVLSTADICVNPDVANEMNDLSTMNKVMEYMALGKPIVQYDLHEGKVSAGPSSLYAIRNDPQDLATKLLELINNPELCKQMGDIGKKRIHDTLEWRHQVPNLLQAYERILPVEMDPGTLA